MVTKMLKFVYAVTPPFLLRLIGRSRILKPLRDIVLSRGSSRTKRVLTVVASWEGRRFFYTGDFKSALKAEKKGIEGTLLRLSVKLIGQVRGKRDNAVIFDIGSSYGFLSTVWGLTVCANGRVYGFEASKFAYDTAQATAVRNGLVDKLEYHNVAVWKEEGVLRLNLHDGTHASMLDVGKNGVDIRALSIDSFVSGSKIESVDLIKVDVDGPEFEVLLGATKTIESKRPILIIESNSDVRIGDWLDSKGYELFDLYLNKGDLKNPPPNIVAIPRS